MWDREASLGCQFVQNDPVNLSLFLVLNTQCWTHFNIFDLILFRPDEGNPKKVVAINNN